MIPLLPPVLQSLTRTCILTPAFSGSARLGSLLAAIRTWPAPRQGVLPLCDQGIATLLNVEGRDGGRFAAGRRRQHAAALGLASQIGDKHQQARAHHGLACSHHATGNPGQARRHWREALALYTTLGTPEVEQVCAKLVAAGEDPYPEQRQRSASRTGGPVENNGKTSAPISRPVPRATG